MRTLGTEGDSSVPQNWAFTRRNVQITAGSYSQGNGKLSQLEWALSGVAHRYRAWPVAQESRWVLVEEMGGVDKNVLHGKIEIPPPVDLGAMQVNATSTA